METITRSATVAHAVGIPVERMVRPLREGEVMAVYSDFDRHADKTLAPAEYLLRFGAAVSAATVKANHDCPAWRFTGAGGLKPYLTQKQYAAQTPGTQRWYAPFCEFARCRDERPNVGIEPPRSGRLE